MTSPEPPADVVAEVLEGLATRPSVRVPVEDAHGLVLAEDVRAPGALPPQARAAMDGIAVHAADTATATPSTPVRLRLDGESLAGHDDVRPLAPGSARSIATGAATPVGADAVARREVVAIDGQEAVLTTPVPVGRDVRPAGDDARSGDVLLPAGTVVGALAVGGLAGCGVTEVRVRPRVRVAVLPTGDEVVAGSTPDAVAPALDRLLAADGATVVRADPVEDDTATLRAAVEALGERADVVLTIGGASVGPRDRVAALVATLPCGRAASLALRPGRPMAWGRLDDGTTLLCLPGSPLAAVAVAVAVVRPVVAALAGRPTPRPEAVVAGEPMPRDPQRRLLVPARPDPEGRYAPVPGSGSADLARMARTTVLLDLAPGSPDVAANDVVDAWRLP